MQVVLDRLKDGAFLGAGLCQLNYGLDDPGEEFVVPQSAPPQIGIHPGLLTGLPKLHDLVDAVHERRRPSVSV